MVMLYTDKFQGKVGIDKGAIRLANSRFSRSLNSIPNLKMGHRLTQISTDLRKAEFKDSNPEPLFFSNPKSQINKIRVHYSILAGGEDAI